MEPPPVETKLKSLGVKESEEMALMVSPPPKRVKAEDFFKAENTALVALV